LIRPAVRFVTLQTNLLMTLSIDCPCGRPDPDLHRVGWILENDTDSSSFTEAFAGAMCLCRDNLDLNDDKSDYILAASECNFWISQPQCNESPFIHSEPQFFLGLWRLWHFWPLSSSDGSIGLTTTNQVSNGFSLLFHSRLEPLRCWFHKPVNHILIETSSFFNLCHLEFWEAFRVLTENLDYG
jgi:hypothetical protein